MNALRFYNTAVNRNLIDDLFSSMTFGDTREKGNCGYVPANIVEDENGFGIEMMIPGFSKDEIRINVQKNTLVIRSEKKEPAESEIKFVRKEFGKRDFERRFVFSDHVNQEGISASFNNGILEILLPKKEEVKEKAAYEIEIQ